MAARSLPGTPSWLGVTNDQKALALLLEHGPLTRNQLGELSQLSKPTAAQMVQRLESAGLIAPVGEVSGGRGPTSTVYGVCHARALGVAIDIQPEITRSVVVDAVGNEYPVAANAHPRAGIAAADELAAAVAAACDEAGIDRAAVTECVVGVQAAVNQATGDLSFTDDMPGWPRTDVMSTLSEALSMRISVWNDVNVAAVAERAIGAGEDLGSFALFWVGNGLGVAFDVDGRVLPGSVGGAGEIGYLSVPAAALAVDPEATELQDLISGEAIAGIARQYGVTATRFDDVVVEIDGSRDRDAILDRIAERIAFGVVPVLAVIDPEAVILGGPIGVVGGARLAEAVRRAIETHTRWRPNIVSTALHDAPVLSGAVCVLQGRLTETLIRAVRTP